MKINTFIAAGSTMAAAALVGGALWLGGADKASMDIAESGQRFSNAPVTEASLTPPTANRAAVEAAVRVASAVMHKVESPSQAMNATAAEAPVILAAAEAAPIELEATEHQADGHENGVLCVTWALQRIGAQIGFVDAETAAQTADNFPIPAPIWLMHKLQSHG